MRGLIFDIQSFSLHDGPGCRTTVFLKGCPLRCRFCANPEGRVKEVTELILHDGSKRMCGYEVSCEDIMRILKRDRQYWCDAGGVTFSGGEPLMQSEFLLSVLQECQESYIHTAIETCSAIPEEKFLTVMPFIDFAFFDIKHMDTVMHKNETGMGNEIILHNIIALSKSAWQGRLIVRLPLIPQFNDDRGNLVATAEFMKRYGLAEINILPFHRMGESKWRQCGTEYFYNNTETQSLSELQAAGKIFTEKGLKCYIGPDTEF